MQKWIVALALGAVVVAVGAVAAVVYVGDRNHSPSAPVAQAPEPMAAVEEKPAAPAPSPAVSRPPRTSPAEAAVKPKSETKPAETPVTDTTAERSETATKVAGILDSLSPAEREEMTRQMRDRQRAEMREQFRSSLPSQMRLQMLNRTRNEALRVSDSQQQQIDALAAMMKPKVQAALSSLYGKEDDLRQKIDALQSAGRQSEAEALQNDLRDTRQQIEAARNQLDQEFQQMLSPILSSEQFAALTNPQSGFGGGDGNFGRGGGRGTGRRGGDRGPGAGAPSDNAAPNPGG